MLVFIYIKKSKEKKVIIKLKILRVRTKLRETLEKEIIRNMEYIFIGKKKKKKKKRIRNYGFQMKKIKIKIMRRAKRKFRHS